MLSNALGRAASLVVMLLVGAGCGKAEHAVPQAIFPESAADNAIAQKHAFAVRLQWQKGAAPAVGEAGTARLVFTNPHGGLSSVENVSVVLWMPIHGHGGLGAPQVSLVKEAGTGVFDVSGIEPSMTGGWQLKVRAAINGKEIDEAVLSFDVQKSTHK